MPYKTHWVVDKSAGSPGLSPCLFLKTKNKCRKNIRAVVTKSSVR
jgi:hypothetical protein